MILSDAALIKGNYIPILSISYKFTIFNITTGELGYKEDSKIYSVWTICTPCSNNERTGINTWFRLNSGTEIYRQ